MNGLTTKAEPLPPRNPSTANAELTVPIGGGSGELLKAVQPMQILNLNASVHNFCNLTTQITTIQQSPKRRRKSVIEDDASPVPACRLRNDEYQSSEKKQKPIAEKNSTQT